MIDAMRNNHIRKVLFIFILQQKHLFFTEREDNFLINLTFQCIVMIYYYKFTFFKILYIPNVI